MNKFGARIGSFGIGAIKFGATRDRIVNNDMDLGLGVITANIHESS
jgi:hypothetical protein